MDESWGWSCCRWLPCRVELGRSRQLTNLVVHQLSEDVCLVLREVEFLRYDLRQLAELDFHHVQELLLQCCDVVLHVRQRLSVVVQAAGHNFLELADSHRFLDWGGRGCHGWWWRLSYWR